MDAKQDKIAKLEDFTKTAILGATASAGAEDADLQQTINYEVALINDFCDLIRQGVYEIWESETVRQGLDKAKDDINGYMRGIRLHIDNFKENIKTYDNQEALLYSQNRDINWKRHELEQELHGLGMFDGARKRELQAQIDALQPVEYPIDYDSKRKELEGKIKALEANIEPFQDKIKGLVHYEIECERHFDSIERQAKEQKQTQKRGKATAEEAETLNFSVEYDGEQLATFKDKEDAEAFTRFKHQEYEKDFADKQLADYIKAHPTNRYGEKTLPGDVPMSETYPEFSKASKEIQAKFKIKDLKKVHTPDLSALENIASKPLKRL
jgi:chromosome segregation ATPase